MNRHVHADKIIAKAENMDLVVLMKRPNNTWVEISNQDTTHFNSTYTYFLCLEEHKEACLHWLNGWICQVKRGDDWVKISDYTHPSMSQWSEHHVFMKEVLSLRIKPKKEKRSIGVNVKTGQTTSMYTLDEEGNYAEDEVRLTKGGLSTDWQIIEIEVEV